MNAPENYGVFQIELIKEERYAHFKVSLIQIYQPWYIFYRQFG